MIFTVALGSGTLLANVRYRWIVSGTEGAQQSTGITQPLVSFPVFRIVAIPPAGAEELIVYDSTDTSNWNNGGYDIVLAAAGVTVPIIAVPLTIPLQAGTSLANVRYVWIISGGIGPVLSVGVTQPSATYPVFRLFVVPPPGAEEVVVYDVTDLANWNVGNFIESLITLPMGAGINVSPALSTLRIQVAHYLRRDVTDLVVDSVDFFIVAANNARSGAERMHNFEYSRLVATLLIDGNNGGALADAVITQADPAVVSVKEVTALRRLRPNGSYIPLDFTRADIPIERERTELEFSDNLWPTFRYPSDADLRARGTASTVIQRGKKLFIYPGFIDAVDNQVTLTIEGFGWLNNYGSIFPVTAPEDFIVEFGYDFLMWSIICELNFMFQTFVPRQEGNLAPPTKERDEAWRELLIWDSYLVDSNVTRSR